MLIRASTSPGSSSTLVWFQQVHLWELGTREPYWVSDRLPIKRAATSSYFICPTHKSPPPFFDSGAVPFVSTSFWTRFPFNRRVFAAWKSHCTDRLQSTSPPTTACCHSRSQRRYELNLEDILQNLHITTSQGTWTSFVSRHESVLPFLYLCLLKLAD